MSKRLQRVTKGVRVTAEESKRIKRTIVEDKIVQKKTKDGKTITRVEKKIREIEVPLYNIYKRVG